MPYISKAQSAIFFEISFTSITEGFLPSNSQPRPENKGKTNFFSVFFLSYMLMSGIFLNFPIKPLKKSSILGEDFNSFLTQQMSKLFARNLQYS